MYTRSSRENQLCKESAVSNFLVTNQKLESARNLDGAAESEDKYAMKARYNKSSCICCFVVDDWSWSIEQAAGQIAMPPLHH